MIKIAFFVHSLCGNNIGRSYPFIKAFLGVKGFKITVFGEKKKCKYFPLLKDLQKEGVTIIEYKKLAEIKTLIQEYDILHVFKPLKHYRNIVVSNINVPVIIDIDDWELGLYLNYLKSNLNSFKSWLPRFFTIKKIISLQEYEQAVKSYSKQIIVNSTFLQKMYGGKVIYTAIDGEFFRPQNNINYKVEYNLNENSVVLGMIGKLTDYKGIDLLIDSFCFVRKKYKNIYLLIPNINKKNEIYKKIHSIKNVIIISEVDLYGYRKYLSLIDIFLIPQQFSVITQAQTPAKLFLAMAMGKAIIATDIGDIDYILRDSGIVVQNKKEFIRNIELLIVDKKLRESYGIAARKRFLENFDLKILRKKMIEIYNRLL